MSTDLQTLYNKAWELETELAIARERVQEKESELRKSVLATKDKDNFTWVLTFNGRKIKAKLNRFNRYKIWEGRKVISNDVYNSINHIRLLIARGIL